jgi:hypothetical protein
MLRVLKLMEPSKTLILCWRRMLFGLNLNNFVGGTAPLEECQLVLTGVFLIREGLRTVSLVH